MEMDIQQLKYFKAVATIGKINEAAESLFVSAPALSTSVSRLEKELGVRLFDRAGNRIVLNAQGKIFLKHTNQILSNLENAKLELQQSLAQHQNSISLISVNTVIWVELITAFTLESPDYTMACSTTSITDLAENGLSPHCRFLLAYENEIPPAFNEELDSVFLFSANPVAMLHKDHPLANETVVSLSALADDKYTLEAYRQCLNMINDLPEVETYCIARMYPGNASRFREQCSVDSTQRADKKSVNVDVAYYYSIQALESNYTLRHKRLHRERVFCFIRSRLSALESAGSYKRHSSKHLLRIRANNDCMQ